MFDWTSIAIGPEELNTMSTILEIPSAAPVSSAVAGTTVTGKSGSLVR
ncbi:hypothetical protein WMF18_30350 [Sorangium sp. So ce315]